MTHDFKEKRLTLSKEEHETQVLSFHPISDPLIWYRIGTAPLSAIPESVVSEQNNSFQLTNGQIKRHR